MKVPNITFEATENIDQLLSLTTRAQAGGFNQSSISQVLL
jgi:hypothetical protein